MYRTPAGASPLILPLSLTLPLHLPLALPLSLPLTLTRAPTFPADARASHLTA